ncbi:MAG: FG-GAP-like repeat-containing protein [Isosphaeraceae bacterium]
MMRRFPKEQARNDLRQSLTGSRQARSQQGRQLRHARPLLDLLEDRCLLSFGSPLLFDTGAGPGVGNAAVAIGDVNGDGVPDLVTATSSGGITISDGNGDGTFTQAGCIPPFAASLSSVTLADLDGQHGLDIIATDPTGNQVWVLLNQGNGKFGTPTPYSTGAGSNPADVAVADLGNGHLDIVTANSGDNTVSILLGDGTGAFQQHEDYDVDTDPVAVAIGSFVQNRGPLDLFTANEGGNSVSVLRGNGDGTFKPALDIPITVTINNVISRNSRPVDVAVGDFNGDGNLDLVTANSGTASVSVLLGNGDGSFGVQQNIVVDTNTQRDDTPTAVSAADLDGDGHCDIAFTEPKRGSIGFLAGNGDGTFATQADYIANGTPTKLATGNLNGDQTSLGLDRLDLVTVDSTDPRAAVLLGQKWFIPTTLGITASTITWGGTIIVKPSAVGGHTPLGFGLSGAFQLLLDGQPYSSAQPVGSTFSYTRIPVGTWTLSARYLGDVDFQPSTTGSVTLTVVPALLTVTALNQSRTYGAAEPNWTYSITGFVNGDFLDQSKLSGAPVFTDTDSGTSSAVGNYTIGIAPGTLAYSDPNYVIVPVDFVSGKLTVQPAALTVTAKNASHTYGQATTFTGLEFSTSGLVNGDSVTSVSLTSTGSAAGASVAGSPYAIVPTAAVGSGLSNYTIVYANGQLTVNPAALAITANAGQSKTYGTSDPALTYSQ